MFKKSHLLLLASDKGSFGFAKNFDFEFLMDLLIWGPLELENTVFTLTSVCHLNKIDSAENDKNFNPDNMTQ